ncbi:MAG: rhodanese-like domain-containing protein [Candidatus Korobacteraceae bacterium]|jgi:thiosulfate/3-mercaptopyruvate sulfurtransferase
MRIFIPSLLIFALGLFSATAAQAQYVQSPSDLAPGSAQLINPEELVNLLQPTKGEKPLVLNIGPSLLYMQAHIPGSEYVGAGSDKQGLERLRTRVKSLPHNKSIVLYCGCCPWSHCPNVRPAYNQLHAMGFNNVKVLYIANNFGSDWVDKGYPTIKGQ